MTEKTSTRILDALCLDIDIDILDLVVDALARDLEIGVEVERMSTDPRVIPLEIDDRPFSIILHGDAADISILGSNGREVRWTLDIEQFVIRPSRVVRGYLDAVYLDDERRALSYERTAREVRAAQIEEAYGDAYYDYLDEIGGDY